MYLGWVESDGAMRSTLKALGRFGGETIHISSIKLHTHSIYIDILIQVF